MVSSALFTEMSRGDQAASDECRGLLHTTESGRVYGISQKFREAFFLAQEVAPSDATILLTGETGVGKGLIAEAIHDLSSRKGKPFVKLNCAAIPLELTESILFGHSKGAFTGADRSNEGIVTSADGGTLFLDEIGDLNFTIQAKLLQFLQDQTFRSVGSTVLKRVNVRIIAATNKNLEKEVEDGRFRADLFFRLQPFVIEIPSLRERRADILLIAENFLESFSRKYNKPLKAFDEDVKDFLMEHSWPGNIRQLEMLVEAVVFLEKDPDFIRLSTVTNRLKPVASAPPPVTSESPVVSGNQAALLSTHYSLGSTRAEGKPRLDLGPQENLFHETFQAKTWPDLRAEYEDQRKALVLLAIEKYGWRFDVIAKQLKVGQANLALLLGRQGVKTLQINETKMRGARAILARGGLIARDFRELDMVFEESLAVLVVSALKSARDIKAAAKLLRMDYGTFYAAAKKLGIYKAGDLDRAKGLFENGEVPVGSEAESGAVRDKMFLAQSFPALNAEYQAQMVAAILRALEEKDWNITDTAKSLGLTRPNLVRWLRENGIKRANVDETKVADARAILARGGLIAANYPELNRLYEESLASLLHEALLSEGNINDAARKIEINNNHFRTLARRYEIIEEPLPRRGMGRRNSESAPYHQEEKEEVPPRRGENTSAEPFSAEPTVATGIPGKVTEPELTSVRDFPSLNAFVESQKKILVIRALNDSQGDVDPAARAAGLTRSSLLNAMHRYNINVQGRIPEWDQTSPPYLVAQDFPSLREWQKTTRKRLVDEAVKQAHGNLTGAARLLKTERSNLREYVKTQLDNDEIAENSLTAPPYTLTQETAVRDFPSLIQFFREQRNILISTVLEKVQGRVDIAARLLGIGPSMLNAYLEGLKEESEIAVELTGSAVVVPKAHSLVLVAKSIKDLNQWKNERMREIVDRAMGESSGNLKLAARKLSMPFETLQEYLRKRKIESASGDHQQDADSTLLSGSDKKSEIPVRDLEVLAQAHDLPTIAKIIDNRRRYLIELALFENGGKASRAIYQVGLRSGMFYRYVQRLNIDIKAFRPDANPQRPVFPEGPQLEANDLRALTRLNSESRRRLISAIVAETSGDLELAAEKLGISSEGLIESLREIHLGD